MKSILKKIKEIDTKILIGIGVSVAVIVIAVFAMLINGQNGVDSEDKEKDSQVLTETETVDGLDETESEDASEEVQQNQTEIQGSEETETDAEAEVNSESQKEDVNSNTTKPSEPSNPTQTPTNTENSSESESQEPSGSEDVPVVTEAHTVSVVSKGGHNLYNVKVHAYTDKAMTKLFTTASTNSKGVATLQLETGIEYTIALSNVPVGYHLSTSYSLTGKTTSIVLESSVVTGTAFPSKKLKVGNVMYDFTVPSTDGSNITLSEVIKTKELVVLNFWYVNCQFCVMEFPYMSSAYNRYEDRVEIIALNPFDNMDSVKAFLVDNPLPFEVATCDSSIPNLFGIDAYPVSVVIDKYGVIRKIEEGAILQESGFVSLFEKYL